MKLLIPLLFVAFIAAAQCKEVKRAFPLFNVVTFKNDPCDTEDNRSSSSGSGSNKRKGNCLASSECNDQKGVKSGNCAASFGVCCLFKKNDEDDNSIDVIRNNTYVQSPNFPTAFEKAETFTYKIEKLDKDICAFRVDFDTFDIKGPADEATACTDRLEITVSNGQKVPIICGTNTGQHIYLDVGTERDSSSETATLKITTEGTDKMRQWDLHIQQIECNNVLVPPQGCLQYHTESSGTIKTFNFDATGDAGPHLPDQDYKVCLRRRSGFCCNEFQVCADTSAFSLDFAEIATIQSKVGGSCTEDFVVIEGGSPTGLFDKTVQTRYCGALLNSADNQAVGIPIISCTSNEITIITDDTADGTGDLLRGACLHYRQTPC